MNKPDSDNQTSKESGISRILNCVLPIAFFTTLVAGAGIWFALFNQVPINNRVASLVQPSTAVNPEKPVVEPSLALTLTPAAKNWQETTHVHGLAVNSNNPVIASSLPIMDYFSVLKMGSGSGWGKNGLITWALPPIPPVQTAFILAVTHLQEAI